MTRLVDLAKFVPTAGGTADWAVSSAVTGYQTPATAGAVSGAVYNYRAESADLSQWEVGTGTYTSSNTTLTRSSVLYNNAGTTAKINFSTTPQVGLVTLTGNVGTWTNTRSAQTSSYALANTDAGKTLAFSGGFYGITAPNPSGYDANFTANLVNEDSSRAKVLLAYYTNSTSSLTIGTGAKAFTVASNLNFAGPFRFRAYSLAASSNFMSGQSNYSGTTLNMTVDATGGSGTFTDWQIAPEIMLWPNQNVTIFNQNNVWQLNPAYQRWKAPNNTVVYIDAINGLNSNDGLATGSGGAVQSMDQGIRHNIKDMFDLTGISAFPTALVTVQLAANASATGISATPYSLAHIAFTPVGQEGRNTILIQGTTAVSPDNIVIADVSGASIGAYGGGVDLEIRNLQVGQNSSSASPVANTGFEAADGGRIRLEGNIRLGYVSNGQLQANNSGSIVSDGAITVAGGGNYLVSADSQGTVILNSQTVTFASAVNYAQQTVSALALTNVQLSNTVWSGSSLVTGTRYFARDNAVIRTDSSSPTTAIPGNAAGTTNTGAQLN
ncbi:hypothetical protein ACQR1Y_12415 [Bradyrhizobium sp. HKCCYLRH3099]|uniref:hypothetical protein n=1 Tax=Bradyrhizobium TaxID=374 RepID=UPI003EBB2F12